MDTQLHALGLEHPLEFAGGLANQSADRMVVQVEHHLAGLELGQIEQIVQQA